METPASVLESGLEVLEEGLRVGDNLRVDFLARDASGTPVLILAVDAEDEQWAPLRILDIDLWFTDNAFLLEKGLARLDAPRLPLRWAAGHRMLVVTLGTSRHFYRRLEGMRGLEVEVYELRSIFLRGETLWFLQGVSPWQESGSPRLATAPEGLEDPTLRDLLERLLLRLMNVSPDLDLSGDRFCREVLLNGQSILRLDVRGADLFAYVSEADTTIELRNDSDVDRVLDSLLRVLLSEEQLPGGASSSRAGGAPKLTEEEMAAFMKASP